LLVNEILPDYVLIENVRGFIKSTNPYRKELLSVLKKNGYHYSEGIVKAEEYGVPQSRHRYVLIASKFQEISLPNALYGPKGRFPYNTVRDAIESYPPLRSGQDFVKIPNHRSRKLSPLNLERIRIISKNGGSRNLLPKRLQLKCHSTYEGHSDVYGRMNWDKPSPTLTCKCNSLSNGRFGHPEQNRGISLREAAKLQTFPDNYIFYGGSTVIAKHIGNAVPVLLAEKIGRVFVAQKY